MDMFRAFLAIALSFLILIGYQFFFVKPVPHQQQAAPQAPVSGTQTDPAAVTQQTQPPQLQPATGKAAPPQTVEVNPDARDITVETPLYKVIISEQGGGVKSFVLKQYRTDMTEDSGPMELVRNSTPNQLPVLFSLDNGAGGMLPLFKAEQEKLTVGEGQETTLVMRAALAGGTQIVRTMTFKGDSYLIGDSYQVVNTGDAPIQVSPAVTLSHESFVHQGSGTAGRFLFSGPASFANGELVETKPKDLSEGSVILQGAVSWTGFVDSYFMTSVAPGGAGNYVVTTQGNEEQAVTVLSSGITTIGAGEETAYDYSIYFGPKKLKVLQATGHDLAKAVNFGWFDILAKPMLWLLNFFHDYVKNYGVAIILVTVLIKVAFWPITQRGMKSMKNMQKLQPKMAKLKEKFKDDPQKMNQEMMAMYKTYKVNPLGGCLPMLIQIPFFFALYRVLMAAIELRHAPFMLWINDLSAPDRLWIGFDIPYLHGLPVLTLLMGASMYLQQKMTPTTADPTQAKIMQFLPVIFTFMFLNFASGLVLYWFVNNLLSILQQQLINRQSNKA